MALSAAVIGCGSISRFHFSGLEKAGVEIRWVCDLNESVALPWKEKFNAKYAADYREALADSAVDLVVVTTASRVHKEICLAAIAAGKAVVCEKTLSENASDSWEIVQAAENAGVIFYTSFMKRFIPAVEKAKELLPSIGTIISTHIRAHQLWGDLWDTVPSEGFFHTPPGGASLVRKSYGGGILVCGGSHILDLVVHLLRRPDRLYAYVHQAPERDYDLQASCLMETANGTVLFEALAHPNRKVGFLKDGWDETFEIIGTRGKLQLFSSCWDKVENKSSLLRHYDNQTQAETEYRFDCISPFDRAVEFFCSNIREGRQGSQSNLTGYEVDELIEHIQLSSSGKRAVEIKWRDR